MFPPHILRAFEMRFVSRGYFSKYLLVKPRSLPTTSRELVCPLKTLMALWQMFCLRANSAYNGTNPLAL
jgi:hypothetical protein